MPIGHYFSQKAKPEENTGGLSHSTCLEYSCLQ